MLSPKQEIIREIGMRSRQYEIKLRKNLTPAERNIKRHLINIKKRYCVKGEYDFPYTFQKPFYDSSRRHYIVDFYFQRTRSCLEIDGGYHNTVEQRIKDAKRTEYLTQRKNCKVYRLTNEQALAITENEFIEFMINNKMVTDRDIKYLTRIPQ